MKAPPVFIKSVPPVINRAAAAPPKMAATKLPTIDLSLLADLPSLTLQARYLVEGFLSGRHRSPQKGASVEFAEYRDYHPGDDLRRVDWRLFGRSDRLHVKQYEEETQLRVFLVLDSSASMDFKSREKTLRKIEFGRIVVAALASLAQRQGDAFGLGIVGAELKDFLRARSSVPHWKTFIARLEAIKPGGPTSLARALNDLAEIIPARSLVMVASDFYEDTAPLQSALRRLRYDHHEIIGLHILDPMETDFDLENAGQFVDVETGGRIRLDAASVRKGYLDRFNQFCGELEEMFRDAGGELTQLRTDQPPVKALTHYLAKREHRL